MCATNLKEFRNLKERIHVPAIGILLIWISLRGISNLQGGDVDDIARLVNDIPMVDSPDSSGADERYILAHFTPATIPQLLELLRNDKYKNLWPNALATIGIICSAEKGACRPEQIIDVIERNSAGRSYYERTALYVTGYTALARTSTREAADYLSDRTKREFWEQRLTDMSQLRQPGLKKEEAVATFQDIAIEAIGYRATAEAKHELEQIMRDPHMPDRAQRAAKAALREWQEENSSIAKRRESKEGGSQQGP